MVGPVISNEFVTPSWMWQEPTIDFTMSGDALSVTFSSDSLVPPGAPQRFDRAGDAWLAHFTWREVQDGDHYWSVTFTGDDCLMAEAVDEDLGIGPGGVWTIPFRGCTITTR